MIKKNFKNYKLKNLQYIKQTYKYIYIFRYNDLTTNENILLKKKLKKQKLKSLVLKQNLIHQIFLNIKNQGSLLIIYGNEHINLKGFVKKINLIYLIIDNIIYSNLKIEKILIQKSLSLNIAIIKPFFNFLYYLRRI